MTATHFQDFKLDDGSPITVEYTYGAGSETTYSPMFGACGGDGCEVSILKAWPNAPAYERLAGRRNDLTFLNSRPIRRRPWHWIPLAIVSARMRWQEFWCQPTDAQRERMEDWLIEHHEYEPYEPEYDYA